MMKPEIVKQWNDMANEFLVGRRIVSASYMAENEARNHGWDSRPIVLTLDNGSVFYPSMDDEGNGAGALFGMDKNGKNLTLPVL